MNYHLWAKTAPPVSFGAKAVLLLLACYVDADGKCWPSQRELAEKLGASERTIGTHLAALEAAGQIRRTHRRNGDRSASDVIWLTPTAEPEKSAPSSDDSARKFRQLSPKISTAEPEKSAGEKYPEKYPMNSLSSEPVTGNDEPSSATAWQAREDLDRGTAQETVLDALARYLVATNDPRARERLKPTATKLERDYGATADQVHARCKAAQRTWRNGHLTPAALLKHWDSLGRQATPHRATNGGYKVDKAVLTNTPELIMAWRALAFEAGAEDLVGNKIPLPDQQDMIRLLARAALGPTEVERHLCEIRRISEGAACRSSQQRSPTNPEEAS